MVSASKKYSIRQKANQRGDSFSFMVLDLLGSHDELEKALQNDRLKLETLVEIAPRLDRLVDKLRGGQHRLGVENMLEPWQIQEITDELAQCAQQAVLAAGIEDEETSAPTTREEVSAEYRRAIPDAILEALNEWVLRARRPGSFVYALLNNNLRDAFSFADDDSREALHQIVKYCHNRLPSACWGSATLVMDWEGCDESELESDSLVWPERGRR